jgi:hypothetical protein
MKAIWIAVAAVGLCVAGAAQASDDVRARADLARARGYFGKEFDALRPAAERGELWAEARLAALYDNGQGVLTSHVEAARWYRRAALQGDAKSMMWLARYHRSIDEAASRAWARRAARIGDAEGLVWTAYDEINQNRIARGVALLRKAAAQGNSYALHELAARSREGRGVPKDLGEASRLEAAAAQAQEREVKTRTAAAQPPVAPNKATPDPIRVLAARGAGGWGPQRAMTSRFTTIDERRCRYVGDEDFQTELYRCKGLGGLAVWVTDHRGGSLRYFGFGPRAHASGTTAFSVSQEEGVLHLEWRGPAGAGVFAPSAVIVGSESSGFVVYRLLPNGLSCIEADVESRSDALTLADHAGTCIDLPWRRMTIW